MLDRIPLELRERPNFVLWNLIHKPGAAKPTKPPFQPLSGWPASVTEPSHWSTFDQARAAFEINPGAFAGIGYVITAEDPYTFIDLDTHDEKLSDEDRKRHDQIANTFKGYAEISPSGRGLHLIVKGKVPTGRRRGGVEIYSAERYMTLTGNVWRDGPIVEQQDLLNVLWAELGDTNGHEYSTAQDKPQTEDDHSLCNKAANAANGDRFVELYKGEWQASYASQSEADFALVDIIGYYTQSHAQIKRIFRASALGQRDKAKRDNYIDPMIARAQDNRPPAIDITKLKASLDAQIAASKVTAPDHRPESEQQQQPSMEVPAVRPEQSSEVYSLPPGLLGEIAQYVYQAAPRPVREVALVAAIGLLSGICGRSYNVNGTGLNQYTLLLAPTGSGKEAIASGLSQLMLEVQKNVPSCMDFMGPGEFRSDVALLKHLANRSPSFLTIGGEFGHTLEQMAQQGTNTHLRAIKRVMLDLYGKSGRGSVLQPAAYSDATKNTALLHSPAFSFIGESSPEIFYAAVDERLVSDGLLPRFTLIEYIGKRPALNAWANLPPSKELVERIGAVCAQSLMLNKNNQAIDVEFAPDAKVLLESFDKECTDFINAQDAQEVIRHIWNRAHLRALKLAALLAVGVHPFQPVITLSCAQWAINLSAYNTQMLLGKFQRGEVGSVSADDKHIAEIKRNIKRYLTEPFLPAKNHHISFMQMHKDRVLPFVVLQNKIASLAAFRNDKRGSTNAIKACLQTLVDSGVLVEMNKNSAYVTYSFNGKVYLIPDFNALSV